MPVQLIRGSSGGRPDTRGSFGEFMQMLAARQQHEQGQQLAQAEELRRQGAFELDQQIRQGRLDAQATEFQQERVSQDFNAQSLAAMYERLDPQLQPQAEILAGALSSGMDAAEGEARIQGLFAQNEALRMERFRQEGAERILRLAENAGGEQEIPELAELAEGVAQGFIDPQKGVQQAEKFAAAAAQKQAFEIRRQEGIAMLDGMRQIVPQVSQQLASIAALGTADPDLGFDEMIGMAGKAMAKYAERLRDDGDPTTDPKSMDPGFEAMRRHMAGQEVPPVPMPQAVTDPGAPAPQGDPVDVPNQLPKDSIPQDGSPEVEQFQASPQAQELQAAGAQAAARGGFDEWVASMGYPNRDAVPDWLLEAIADQIINLPGRTPEEYGDAEKVEYSLHGDVSGEQMRRALHGGS